MWKCVEKCQKVWKGAETILPFSCCPLVFLWKTVPWRERSLPLCYLPRKFWPSSSKPLSRFLSLWFLAKTCFQARIPLESELLLRIDIAPENAKGGRGKRRPPTENSIWPPSHRYTPPPPSQPVLLQIPLEIPRISLRWPSRNQFWVSKN